MAIHYDGEGQCIVCGQCGQYIRPSQMSGSCSGPTKQDKSKYKINILSTAQTETKYEIAEDV